MIMSVIGHIEYQLCRFAEGHYTVNRLIDLAKDQLDTVWDELPRQEVKQLDNWLRNQVRTTNGEARLRWGLVREVFDTVLEARPELTLVVVVS